MKPTQGKKPFYLRPWTWVVAGLVIFGSALNALGYKGSSSIDDPTNSSSPSAAAEVTFKSKGCLEVSKTLLNGIGSGFQNATLSGRAAGFLAPDFEDVKFVAVEFTPDGLEDSQIALFATNDDDLGDEKVDGLIIPVDGFAKEFTDWGQQADKLGIYSVDEGASDATACVKLLG